MLCLTAQGDWLEKKNRGGHQNPENRTFAHIIFAIIVTCRTEIAFVLADRADIQAIYLLWVCFAGFRPRNAPGTAPKTGTHGFQCET